MAATATLQAVREQADRAASAAHAAALRDQQTGAITDCSAARKFTRAVDRLYTEPYNASVDSARSDFLHAQGSCGAPRP